MATHQPKRIPLPSRNPLPLSATQEAQVRELYHQRVRGYCANEIRGTIYYRFRHVLPTFSIDL